MKGLKKIPGTIIGILISAISILAIQSIEAQKILIEMLFSHNIIYELITEHLIGTNPDNPCNIGLISSVTIYLGGGLLLSILFYWIHWKNKIGKAFLATFMIIQFYLLQFPFFLIEIGCKTDGQGILAVLYSSPKVSLTLIGFGLIFDTINFYRVI